ncbi:putative glycosyltransferase EpsD [Planctomycetes bacterium CA13]|uniref:Putative glycosyltransferase EpsD n=1 Tax=Novipirellula herctigrandis TaxID=2527986 RepID=A0A5C5Z4Y3_9BACT|nr:putative glycosyltransferase EpsD [Planctomycetes bacterium CA13]
MQIDDSQPRPPYNLHDAKVDAPRKTKVVFVQHSLPRAGGAEQVLYDLISRLDQQTIEPVLCCLYELGELGQRLKDSGCKTHEHLVTQKLDPRNIGRIAKILKQENADILYVTDAFHNMVVGRLAAYFAGTTKTVLAFHSFDTVLRDGDKMPFARRLVQGSADRMLHPTYHRVIALAEGHKEYLASTKKIAEEKIAVVHNGIDHHRFCVTRDKSEARTKLGLPTDKQIVGIVAALRPWKSHDKFLESASKIAKEAPNTLFLIAGQGKERENLVTLTKKLGLEKNVQFMGQVSDVPTFLQSLDISVLTSFHEAFPLSLLESMSSGLPVVSTDVGSVNEIIDDSVTGYLVPFGDTDLFAQKVVSLLQNGELAKQLGDAGRKKVEDMFTVDHMVHRMETIFHDLVASDRESR